MEGLPEIRILQSVKMNLDRFTKGTSHYISTHTELCRPSAHFACPCHKFSDMFTSTSIISQTILFDPDYCN